MEIPTADSVEEVKVISTGLPQLDKAIGVGGIPIGRITEISGKWSAGKSTLGMQIVSQAQKMGIVCVWHDTEFTWSSSYARELGVDTSKLLLLQMPTAEEGLDVLLELAREKKNYLFIVDSVGGLHPKDEAERESGARTIGAQAGLIARFCRKIVPNLSLRNHALIMLNHEYLEIGALRPTVKTSGGEKLSYHKSVWIRLNRTGMNVKVGEKIVGYKAEAEIRKNKVASTERTKVDLEMEYGRGFLASANLFDEAKEAGVLREEGRTWFFGEEKIGSISKVKEALKEEDFAAKVQAALV